MTESITLPHGLWAGEVWAPLPLPLPPCWCRCRCSPCWHVLASAVAQLQRSCLGHALINSLCSYCVAASCMLDRVAGALVCRTPQPRDAHGCLRASGCAICGHAQQSAIPCCWQQPITCMQQYDLPTAPCMHRLGPTSACGPPLGNMQGCKLYTGAQQQRRMPTARLQSLRLFCLLAWWQEGAG